MTAWFTPTAANYFGKVSKPAIIDAMRDVLGATAYRRRQVRRRIARNAGLIGWPHSPRLRVLQPEIILAG